MYLLVASGREVVVQSSSPSTSSSLLLCTDASLTGWGAHHLSLTVAGIWSLEEKGLHNNVLEMKTFLDRIIEESVVLVSDSATVITTVGTVWKVCDLEQEVVPWTKVHSVALKARYIPWKKSILADQLSHPDQVFPTEWSPYPRFSTRSAKSSVALKLTYLLREQRPSSLCTHFLFCIPWL